VDNIKMGLKEIGREAENYTHLAEDMVQWSDVVNKALELWVP
jgi:hypothetical protein